MIKEDKFVEGRTYFMLGFYDRALSIPMIQTYIFVKKKKRSEMGKEGQDIWYFEQPKTEPGPEDSRDNTKSLLLQVDEKTIHDFLDLDGLIGELERFRREAGAAQ